MAWSPQSLHPSGRSKSLRGSQCSWKSLASCFAPCVAQVKTISCSRLKIRYFTRFSDCCVTSITVTCGRHDCCVVYIVCSCVMSMLRPQCRCCWSGREGWERNCPNNRIAAIAEGTSRAETRRASLGTGDRGTLSHNDRRLLYDTVKTASKKRFSSSRFMFLQHAASAPASCTLRSSSTSSPALLLKDSEQRAPRNLLCTCSGSSRALLRTVSSMLSAVESCVYSHQHVRAVSFRVAGSMLNIVHA